MCDPISIAGLALSTAGGLAQGNAQKQYAAEVNAQNKRAYEMSQRAREEERGRQGDFERQMFSAYDETAENLSRSSFEEDQTGASENFVDALAARTPEITAQTRLAGQDGASVEVKNTINSRVNQAADATRQRIKALADLTGYGRAGEGRAADLTDAGSTLSTLGGLRRGSLGVSQQEQNIAAADVTPGSSIIGQILSGVGGAVSMKGGYGKTPAGTGKPAAPTFSLFNNFGGR